MELEETLSFLILFGALVVIASVLLEVHEAFLASFLALLTLIVISTIGLIVSQ